MDDRLTAAVLQVARRAGDAILSIYNAAAESDVLNVQHKADQSPLTAADLAAHTVIADGLKLLSPDIPLVSEEDESSLTHRKPTGRFWLIDPLDGTKEFIARNGEFTVNIALVDEGQVVWGVVYAPVVDELFWGGKSAGAWCERRGQQMPLQTSGRGRTGLSRLSDVSPSAGGAGIGPLRVLGSKSHMNDETIGFIQSLGSTELIQAGSSLKFCRIAQGLADVYPRIGPTCEWDTAAAQAVLEGAGGRVCELSAVDGRIVELTDKPLRYGKPELLNPHFVAWG